MRRERDSTDFCEARFFKKLPELVLQAKKLDRSLQVRFECLANHSQLSMQTQHLERELSRQNLIFGRSFCLNIFEGKSSYRSPRSVRSDKARHLPACMFEVSEEQQPVLGAASLAVVGAWAVATARKTLGQVFTANSASCMVRNGDGSQPTQRIIDCLTDYSQL